MNPTAVETSRALAEEMERNERSEAAVAPGLYPGMPFEQYHAIEACSNTAMGWLKKSPMHLLSYLQDPPKATDPQDFGSALHALVLEPDAFPDRYAQGPCDDRRLKAWKDFEKTLPIGVTGLTPEKWTGVHTAAENLLAHPRARRAIEGVTGVEVSGVWRDEDTGILCKMRADGINPSMGAVIDLKTTTDASEAEFPRSVARFGYYRQGAFYREGIQALVPETEWRHHLILAVESAPPYAPAAYRLADEVILLGRDEVRGTPFKPGLLATYGRCVETGCFPGYADDFVEITLKAWDQKRIESEVYGA